MQDGDASFAVGDSKASVDAMLPEPDSTGDSKRPLLYVYYDRIRPNLRLGYDQNTRQRVQIRL